MSKLVTDRRAISSKTYPGTARLDMETSPLLEEVAFNKKRADDSACRATMTKRPLAAICFGAEYGSYHN